MKNKQVQKQQAGVTLLELLVAITIVSLLATTALFAWRVGVSAWEQASERLEHDRGVLAAHELLAEQMASMTPYTTQLERGGRVLFFQGSGETARFISRYSLTHRAASGLYLVEYHVAVEQDETPSASLGTRKQLLLRETPLRVNGELDAMITGTEFALGALRPQFREFAQGTAAVVLIEGLEECRFEYYQPATQFRPGVWTAEWSGGADEIPAAMRIHATAREETGALKPVAVVAAVRNYVRRRTAF